MFVEKREERTPFRPHVENVLKKKRSHAPYIRNSWVQVVLLALVAFGSRGMWAALNSLGGAGTQEVHLVTIVNVLFSATYCASGWLGGGIVNMTGPRAAMAIGTLSTSALITLIYLYAFHRAVSSWLVLLCACVDGVAATILWSAISYVLLFYPQSSQRGRAMTVFNTIYNLGAVTGAVLTLCLNSSDASDSAAPTLLVQAEGGPSSTAGGDAESTTMTGRSYLMIIGLTYVAFFLSLLLTSPARVSPAPSAVIDRHRSTFRPATELRALWFAATHKYTFYLACLFLVTSWHLVFLFNWVNATYFNVRSRAANSAVYWTARIVATYPLQFALDSKKSSLRLRALRGVFLLILSWVAASAFLACVCLLPIFRQVETIKDIRRLDISEAAAIAPILSFAFFGAVDTIGQSFSVWVVGALPLDPPTAARICGVYRSLQGLGQMASWLLDVHNFTPYRWQFVICSTLWAVSFLPLVSLILKHLDPYPLEPFVTAEKEPPAVTQNISAPTTARSHQAS